MRTQATEEPRQSAHSRRKLLSLFEWSFARSIARNETVQGMLIFAILVLIFLRTPLRGIQDHYYAPIDFMQSHSLTMVEPGYRVRNGLMGDPAVVLDPWLMFNRDNLGAGQIPLWNPYNGGGVPHLANFQSAVFSLYSLPFYLLDLHVAFVLAAFLKLFTLGLFTYLFLKLIGLGQGPALIGATAFTFSGQNILWLSYHNTESAIVLPAGLYFIERVFKQFVALQGRVRRVHAYFWSLVGLSLSITVGLLAGHPETFYFSLLLLIAYIVFRLVDLLFRTYRARGIRLGSSSSDIGNGRASVFSFLHLPYDLASIMNISRLAGALTLAGILAVGIAAVQLLPFLEYFQNSAVAGGRSNLTAGNGALHGELWPLLFIPNLLGSPADGLDIIGSLGFTNYTEANTVYVGGFALLLFVLSFRFLSRDRYIAFFCVSALIWGLYAYNVLGAGNLFRIVPGLSVAPVTRSQAIWAFCVSCGSALYMDHLLRRQLGANWRAATVVLLGALVLVTVALVGVQTVLQQFSQQILRQSSELLSYVLSHVTWFAMTLGLGVVGFLVLCLTRNMAVRVASIGIVLAAVYLQSGELLRGYTPTIDERFFYPVTPSIKQVQQIVGGEMLTIIGYDNMTADANMVYKLSMPSAYDAIWIRYYDTLYRTLFGLDSFPRTASKVSERGLKLFGVQYVAMPGPWPPLETELIDLQIKASKTYVVGEILPQQEVSQTFSPTKDRLQAVMMRVSDLGRRNDCNFEFSVEDLSSGNTVASERRACSDVQGESDIVLSFSPIPNSKDRTYRLVLRSASSRPGNAIGPLARSDFSYSRGLLSLDGQPKPGGLIFDFSYNWNAFTKVAELGSHTLFRYLQSPSRYYTVDQAVTVQSDEEALRLVLDPSFAPERTVVLRQISTPASETAASNAQGSGTPVQVISETPTSIKLNLNRTEPGYLVLTKPYYPGWKAKVNGVDKPVLRADYAFNAVEVDAGASSVEFYYDPDSFKLGVLLTLASLGLGLCLVVWWLWRRPGRAAG